MLPMKRNKMKASNANFTNLLTMHMHSLNIQIMCTIVDDLYLLNKVVYFWNWNKDTMGVLCRLKSKMSTLFKDANCEEELLKSLNIENVIISNIICSQTEKQ